MTLLMMPFMVLALLLGGENSLTGYVNPELYWQSRGIEYEVESLSKLLTAAPAVDPDEIRKWVGQLGAEAFAEREAASRALAALGAAAKAELSGATSNRDPEVVRRATLLLSKIEAETLEEKPLDPWMALYALSKMEDPAAAALLKKVADGGSGEDLQKMAADILGNAEKAETRSLPAGEGIFAGFPADTRAMVQMTPPEGVAAVREALLASSALQNLLYEVLEKTGDITLYRISFGLNEGMFTGVEGRYFMRLEMDYDPERIAKHLGENRFQEDPEAPGKLMRQRHLSFYFADNRNLCVFFDLNSSQHTPLETAQRLMREGGDPTVPDNLQKLYRETDPNAFLRGAGVFSEEMMKNFNQFSTLRSGRVQLTPSVKDGGGIALSAHVYAETAERAGEFQTYLKGQLDEIAGEFQRERDAPPLHTSLQNAETSVKGVEVRLGMEFSGEILKGTVESFSQGMEQRQMHMNRNNLQQPRQINFQEQQLMNQQRGVIVF